MSSSITLYDDAGNPVVVSGEALKKGLATAWVNFDGAGTILASYNVSRIEVVSIGSFDVFFTEPMDNIEYAASGSSKGLTNSSNLYHTAFGLDHFEFQTVNSVRLGFGAGTLIPPDNVSCVVFGGKS